MGRNIQCPTITPIDSALPDLRDPRFRGFAGEALTMGDPAQLHLFQRISGLRQGNFNVLDPDHPVLADFRASWKSGCGEMALDLCGAE